METLSDLSTQVVLSEGGAPRERLDLSIVIPVLDEQETVVPLYHALVETCEGIGQTFEVIFVDDGSTDETFPRLAAAAEHDHRLVVVQLRRNFGQTAAIAAGFDHARGDVIIPMDGDAQNDPRDIPRLLEKLDQGYDVVSGWRVDRQDGTLRRIPSHVANWLIGRVTGVRLHDYGCSLKAYRADLVKEMKLYGEMHRFLPALAHLVGARITEIPVQHHRRMHGRSKYGIRRTLKVVLDLITVRFLSEYATKPIYVFGGIGSLLCGGGVLAGAYTLYEKYVDHIYVYRNPLILVAVFLFLLGVNLILMGLLAELIVRTYHESQNKPTYSVRTTLNEAP
ncbi:MAG TPA: glycosyltransferase family 2 protein [Gaiellaceae bacterium]|nr:glycosyltransferase family 2 protein [Gaiellaceae bacterium]